LCIYWAAKEQRQAEYRSACTAGDCPIDKAHYGLLFPPELIPD
jgi:hypothetical protein